MLLIIHWVMTGMCMCVCVFVIGGGAIEMELSKYLRDYSRTVAGKEQMVIAAVGKALEVIPRQLCDNAGFDSTTILNRLRQAHAQGINKAVLVVIDRKLVSTGNVCAWH